MAISGSGPGDHEPRAARLPAHPAGVTLASHHLRAQNPTRIAMRYDPVGAVREALGVEHENDQATGSPRVRQERKVVEIREPRTYPAAEEDTMPRIDKPAPGHFCWV